MRISTGMIPRSRFSTTVVLTTVAQAADSAGLTRIWMGDRLVIPPTTSQREPWWDFPWDISRPQLEGIVAMTWMLAATTWWVWVSR